MSIPHSSIDVMICDFVAPIKDMTTIKLEREMDYKSNFITHLRQKRHMNVTAQGCEYKS